MLHLVEMVGKVRPELQHKQIYLVMVVLLVHFPLV
jgi:hypothetical protein